MQKGIHRKIRTCYFVNTTFFGNFPCMVFSSKRRVSTNTCKRGWNNTLPISSYASANKSMPGFTLCHFTRHLYTYTV